VLVGCQPFPELGGTVEIVVVADRLYVTQDREFVLLSIWLAVGCGSLGARRVGELRIRFGLVAR
jgi:hypothetical protein